MKFLSIMALHTIREICSDISGKWCSHMVEETNDLPNIEQMVISLQYVADDLSVHKEVRLDSLETNTNTIFSGVEDILLRMNIKIADCNGHCYNGANNMSGSNSGVATQIVVEKPVGLCTHYHGHVLNLASQDYLNGVKLMQVTLDRVYEITKLIEKSPKRDTISTKLKKEISTGSLGVIYCVPQVDSTCCRIDFNFQKLQRTSIYLKCSPR